MDDIDNMFRDLEKEISVQFTDDKAREIWGSEITNAQPEMTIKSSVELKRAPQPQQSGRMSVIESVNVGTAMESSVMLTMNRDGSTSMTMPGASVTLSPRRTSVTSGGEYEIGEVLGKGGMGIVNAARQASLDRRIVVKTIRPEYAGRVDAQEKFITEALATGSLDHPNVVPIHDMGVGGDGKLFYVMKEARGKNWRELLPTLSESENIDILMRVCDAIACAHDKGIIHRDLKPENVMLGDYGEVLVMDWGLAAAISPTAKAAHLTDATACAGTPSFMAPEMARGMAHDLGPWSDQYLLGAILFNILAGKPPHPGKNAQEGVRNAANNIIVPSERKDEWMNVAMRAMHEVPYKRYPSVKAFQKALRNCQVHHESIILANTGDALLAQATEGGGHNEYTRAINAYEQSLVLWKENANAAAKLVEAKYAYAASAFENGDYGLVLSLLGDSGEEREQQLVADAKKEMALREARRRRVKILGILAASLLLLVAIISGAAYFIISQQAEAERQARSEAERQRRTADAQRNIAEQRRKEADEQRAVADEQRTVADEQRKKAEDALQVAEAARVAEALEKDRRLKEQEAKLAAEERARQRAEEALRAREEIQRMGYLEDNSRWRFDAAEAVRRQEAEAERFSIPVERTFALGGAELEMRLIPSGYYVMGSPPRDPSRNNDEYLHEVELSRPFHMGVTEVTRRQWQAVVGIEKVDDLGIEVGDTAAVNVAWRLRPVPEGEADLPASGISHNEIVALFLPALARKLPDGDRFRLPTEAEWEWAARAGTTGHFYTGDSEKNLDACGWYDSNSDGRSQTVAQKEANAWGMRDIIGNVWELTLDSYDSLYYLRAPRVDPVNLDPATDMRVARGGSYINTPRLCRMSYRSTFMHRDNRYPHAGFRLVYASWDLSRDGGGPGTDPDTGDDEADVAELQRLKKLEDTSLWTFDAAEAGQRQEAAAKESGLSATTALALPDTDIVMRVIPAGQYVMGSPARDPSREANEFLHEVEITRPFAMSATPVTRRQWQAVMGVESGDGLHEYGGSAWRLAPVSDDTAELPATGISYRAVVDEFLPKLTALHPDAGDFRLPTEAEWEWAARAGTAGSWYAGDGEAALASCAWYMENSDDRLHRIGEKIPNAWGLYDILGNVWEMTGDAYDQMYYTRSPKTDPANPDASVAERVMRGGSYLNKADRCRVSFRNTYMSQENTHPHVGFRLVRSGWIPGEDGAASR